MTPQELRRRTYTFALRTLRLVRRLPGTREGRIIGDQLLRSSGSVAANYRACCRGRTRKEFAAKIGVALEEVDESALWLPLLIDGEVQRGLEVQELLTEAEELTAILAASWRTAKGPSKGGARGSTPRSSDFRAEDLLAKIAARTRT